MLLSRYLNFPLIQIQHEAAAKIQACYRGYIVRMDYLVNRECVIICQSVARRWLTLRHLEVMDAAAYVIQCVYRDYLETASLRYFNCFIFYINFMLVFYWRKLSAAHIFCNLIGLAGKKKPK